MRQPLLAEEADIQIHAIERAQRADRIRAVFQNARAPDFVGLLEELRERIGRIDEVVELFVVQLAAGDAFQAELLRFNHPRQQFVERVHRSRIIDVVAGYERRVQ